MPTSVAALASLQASLALLRTRRFGSLWFASLLSNIGTWAQQVAQPWLLLSLGASPFLIGLDSFAMNAPGFALTLVGGLLADRADRRIVIFVFQSIQMLCPTLIAFLLMTGHIKAWIVISMSLIIGITDALSMPSFQSIVPSIVERKQIPTGLALNSSQFNLSRILGPALAGVLITSTGVIGCFFVSALSYLPFIAIALFLLPRSKSSQKKEDMFDAQHPLAGFIAILRAPLLRSVLLTVMTTSLFCGPLLTFCSVLVKSGFHGNADQFSKAIAAFGLGGLVGAIGLLSIDQRRDRRQMSFWFATAYGVIVILAAVTPWLWSLPILLVMAGFSMTVSYTSANTVLLTAATSSQRGRTVSMYMLALLGGSAIGGLLTGVSIGLLGVRSAFLINGGLAVSVHLLLNRRNIFYR